MPLFYLTFTTLCLALTAFASGAATQPARNPVVVIETSLGDITVELFPDRAPITVENFLAYAKAGFYSSTIFHRVIKGFMVQGGGMTADMRGKATKPPIKNEATNGLKNTRGTIAMARTSEVDSATSQFFINTVDNAFLDHKSPDPKGYGYTVFGRVTAGMDAVDKIAAVKTGQGDVPAEAVVIKAIRIKE